MNKIIVIVGPTATGKTKLSLDLALLYNAEIINGDSVSIYKRLNIGSAKPTIEERSLILHHLIDIKDINDDYSVYDYQKDVRQKIEEIFSRGKNVIIVGGTGLYIKAALYNYEFQENNYLNTYDNLSNDEIYAKVKSYSPKYLPEKNNRRRLTRLLNKLENNEKMSHKKDELLYNVLFIGLTCDRSLLYERINNRVNDMLNSGLLDEINSLKDYYSKSRILNSAIGYKEFYNYLFNNESLEDTIEKVKQNSRHLAKRQYTFFNHQFTVKWFTTDFNNFQNTIDEVNNYIKEKEV